jgi:hypothetical protein
VSSRNRSSSPFLLAGLNYSVNASLRRNLAEDLPLQCWPAIGTLEASIRDMGEAAEKVSVLVNQDILSGTYATPPQATILRSPPASLEKGLQGDVRDAFANPRTIVATSDRPRAAQRSSLSIARIRCSSCCCTPTCLDRLLLRDHQQHRASGRKTRARWLPAI